MMAIILTILKLFSVGMCYLFFPLDGTTKLDDQNLKKWGMWYTHVMPALSRQTQNPKLQASMGYTAESCLIKPRAGDKAQR